MPKQTQLERFIAFARSAKTFSTWDIIKLGMTQQNARIFYAREQFGCTCGERNGLGEQTCTASEHIRCVRDNHYEYVVTNSLEEMVKKELFEDKGPVPFGDPTPKQALTVSLEVIEPPKEWSEAKAMILAKLAAERRSFR